MRQHVVVLPFQHQRRARKGKKTRRDPFFTDFLCPDDFEADLRGLASSAREGGGVHFTPMEALPGKHGRSVMWIMQDAAGQRKATPAEGGHVLLRV